MNCKKTKKEEERRSSRMGVGGADEVPKGLTSSQPINSSAPETFEEWNRWGKHIQPGKRKDTRDEEFLSRLKRPVTATAKGTMVGGT